MLACGFFHIRKLEHNGQTVEALLDIDSGHQVFQGHFPGQPVVPGVCMMQIVKEILQTALQRRTRLVSAGNLKFLSLIDPTRQEQISAQVKYGFNAEAEVAVTATLTDTEVTYFKMNAVFVFETTE